MGSFNWLWTTVTELTWWQIILVIAYAIYFIIRSAQFWEATKYQHLGEGYKDVIFGTDGYFRIYHIIRIVFDIPPAIFGLFFPFLRSALAFKLYEFKPKSEVKR